MERLVSHGIVLGQGGADIRGLHTSGTLMSARRKQLGNHVSGMTLFLSCGDVLDQGYDSPAKLANFIVP